MDAMSLTPRHFLTSWTIILSLPLSPASPLSGTATAAVVSSSTGSTRELPALSTVEVMVRTKKQERENKREKETVAKESEQDGRCCQPRR